MAVIAVTGSVGAGKTTFTNNLARKLKCIPIHLSEVIAKNHLSVGYDKKRSCDIVDIKSLNQFVIRNIIKKAKKDIIIDSHLSHHLPKQYVDLCIVVKCDLKTLAARLKQRGYDRQKIRENLDCEIFNVCLTEAQEKKHRIAVIDASKRLNIDKIAKELQGVLK
ncbi:MAG TPA: AAA family ATPase [Candidatus Nanoarchaeia archaeon]|nr:AAA family ATPase [Candidatus Nanoarchaeia archaeon]